MAPVTTPPATPDDPLINAVFGERFRILSRIGSGGMGVAYRAWDMQQALPVVVKMPKDSFLDDPRFVERFAREIRLLQGLSHPHVVPIVGIGSHGRTPFVAMRFLPGGSLTHRRLRDAQGTPLPNPTTMLHHWLPAVARALDYIHGAGVVHRDVKPGNVFFDAGWMAFLGDFGVAKVVAESESFEQEHTLTATGMGIGTQAYMAPEQFTPKARLDGRVDQYALAVMVFELVSGQRPFTGEKANLIVEVLTKPAPLLATRIERLPPTVVTAVQRGLAKRPEERFPTCGDFASAVLRDISRPAEDNDLVRLLCPQCGKLLKLPSSYAGRRGTCGKCRGGIAVSDDLGALWMLSEVGGLSLARPVDAPADPAMSLPQRMDEPLEEFPSVTVHPPKWIHRRSRRVTLLEWVGAAIVAAGLCGVVLVLLTATAWRTPTAGTRRDRRPATRAAKAKPVASLSSDDHTASDGTPRSDMPAPRVQRPGDVVNAFGMLFRRIPRGRFFMGDEAGRPGAQRQEVELSKDFFMAAVEVTNDDWMRIMHVDREKLPSRWKDNDLPVTNVTQIDAMAFCEAISSSDEEQRAGRSYRLPTEAEWERACRAGTTTRFPFTGGEEEDLVSRHAWYAGNSLGRPRSVARKQPNAWGLYDMHGNAWEWCLDMYRGYAPSRVVDPLVEGFGDVVRRGGSFRTGIEDCRSAKRGTFSPTMPDEETGLRLVMEVSGERSAGTPTTDPERIPFAGHQYWFSSGVAPFIEADTVARSMGGELVIIDDAEENAFLTKRLKGATWLGLRKRVDGWAGGDRGPIATYFAWAAGQPSNHAAETSAAIHEAGFWHDHFPGDALYFCVEFSGNAVPPMPKPRDRDTGQPIGKRSRPPIIENALGMRFQLLPAGAFSMGSKGGGEAEAPVRRVRITKAFYMGVHEVTGDQWLAVMGSNPSRWRGKERPVEQVSWEAATDYCRALGHRESERTSGHTYRLPTEAEWEYACRAGTTTTFATGDKPESLLSHAWFRVNGADQTHPVGEREPNPWGLHDMHGNVWEWCSDWYGPYPSSQRTTSDPTGPSEGTIHVLRGGSWCDDAVLCRSAYRNPNGLGRRIGNVGLRVVLEFQDAPVD